MTHYPAVAFPVARLTIAVMCGRYTDSLTWEEMVRLYDLTEPEAALNLQPRYNIAPTQTAAVIRPTAKGGRSLALLRWGLIPSWSRDAKVGARMINARGETVSEKPSFRDSFRSRRCLIPADGFYEWRGDRGAKKPSRIEMKDGSGFAFAGLWDRWTKAEDGIAVDSFTIITTTANDVLRPLHERMPVILNPDDYDAWLDTRSFPPDAVQPLLRPYPDAAMTFFAVSQHVNNVRHDDPECIAPERTLL
jgi:putative SOS response-associated peptidase YedK